MRFNVATLLREPVGSTREYQVEDETAEVDSEGYQRLVDGKVRLLRTSRGILVRAQLEVTPTLQCARCLRDFEATLPLAIEEVFEFERDPLTGELVEDIEPDTFRLEGEQYLDLSDAVRQYEYAAWPISPLCRSDCAGLCPDCGTDLNDGPHTCEAAQPDARWSELAALADRLRGTEETDGRPEA